MTATPSAKPRPRVALFITCMVDLLYPRVGLAAAELLERSGADVVFPPEQTCCGQPAFNAGHRAAARQLARRFLDVFWPLIDDGRADAIVAPGGSCVAMVKHLFPLLFEGHDSERRRALSLGEVTFELTQYLVDVLGVTEIDAGFHGVLTYHPCCHLLRELRVDAQPRRLLAGIREARHVELSGAEECCGFGGLFALKNADISTAMGRRKAQNITASGADVVALCDVSCMAHLNGLLQRAGRPPRAVHIAELLAGMHQARDSDRSP